MGYKATVVRRKIGFIATSNSWARRLVIFQSYRAKQLNRLTILLWTYGMNHIMSDKRTFKTYGDEIGASFDISNGRIVLDPGPEHGKRDMV